MWRNLHSFLKTETNRPVAKSDFITETWYEGETKKEMEEE
jgi:hypothetical protein